MIGTIAAERTRSLEFGIYRDGDNNLDDIQAATIAQAAKTSATDRGIEFTVEDTTARKGFAPAHVLRTEDYTIADGATSKSVAVGPPRDMSARETLAAFVATTLDHAETAHATSTWVDLVDHGGGDGGGLEADHGLGVMREDDMAGAIADGVARHAQAHPEDAGRGVDGVIANQCLMATVAFSAALSHAGVKYLAASPETMLAPGVPSSVAHDIARDLANPDAMAKDVVDTTMDTSYGAGAVRFGPAAAFDVIDLDPKKIAAMTSAVKALDGALASAGKTPEERTAVRADAKAIDGMVRFPDGAKLPWRADRPAIALYNALAQDTRLDTKLRAAALHAANAVADTVMAHRESSDFAPFDDANYADAYGPTVHFPLTPKTVDPWAPQISETDNAFYKNVGAAAVTKVFA